MTILHVMTPSGIGGMERVVEMLAAGQCAAGDDVHVAAVPVPPEAPDVPVLRALRSAGVAVRGVAMPPHRYLAERAAIADLCVELAPDVIHTHGYRADVVSLGLARRARAAAVTTIHGFTGGVWKNRLYERIQRHVARQVDAVVAVSEPLARELRAVGVAADRLHLVVNGCAPMEPVRRDEARSALDLPPDGFVAGWVGRLSHEKGLDVLIDALAHPAAPRLTLAVVGDGPLRVALEARAVRLGVNDRIRWCGVVPGAGRYFSAFDVLVMSSRTEGTPIVALEAMHAGVPLIATAVGGLPDIIPADAGVLVASDDPPTLAVALALVEKDRHGAGARAACARGYAQRNFGIQPWVARYREVYRTAARRIAH
ncbi:MAG: glycosyltransferase [Gemmatimonadales bacterium]